MKFPPFAKAIVGAVVAGAAPVASSAATTGTVDTSSGVAAIVSALVGGVLTYFVPNGSAKKPVSVGSLVVTLKTDAEAFLAAFGAGLPTLVETAAKAALQPAPKVNPGPATPAAAPVAQVVDPGTGEGMPDVTAAATPAPAAADPAAAPVA